MAQYQLPAHLQNRQRVRKLSEYASAGIGAGQPPHISIQGNEFTLIDAAGNEHAAEGNTLQAVIVDMNKNVCKMFYGKDWTPDSNDPPVCWSTNGLAPSRDAITPQSPTCESCENNVRGSAVSKISGASIKACRDEKHLAVYLPKYPGMMFRLVVTPGSFKNWAAFSKPFEGQDVDLNDVLVTIGFQPKTNGVLTFQAQNYIDPETVAICDQALLSKATDALVGRNDVPYPGYYAAIGHSLGPAPLPLAAPAHGVPSPSMPTALPQTQIAAPVATAASEQPPFNVGGHPPQQQITAPPQQRRRRRTAAEMAEAKAGQGNGQPAAQPAAQAPQQAPFRPAPAPGPAASFGVQAGAAPNPEVAGMLNSIFKR